MLREIIKFYKSISTGSYDFRFIPVEGIHIQISLDENGQYQSHQREFYKKGREITYFLQSCLKKQLHANNINMNKAFDKKKKIHSCSPFCVAFKIKTLNEIQNRLDNYFSTAIAYCENKNYQRWGENYHLYCKANLLELIKKVMADIEIEQKEKDKKFKLSEKYYIYAYLSNMSQGDFEIVHKKYLVENVFNKNEFNIDKDGITYGVSDYLSGYNQKKPFLQHQTAAFDINSRFSNEDALILYQFSQLQRNRLLPNPLPVFIDKEELNKDVVKIFNREGEKKITYSEIIQEVYSNKGDLGNYYLFNFSAGTLRDFDFVSSFQYKIDPAIYVKDLFSIYGGKPPKLENIFDFERTLVQKIFDNQLIQKRKDKSLGFRYFDDIDYKPQYIRATMYQLVLKYRKAFYDYIYKSKHSALNCSIFHDIMRSGILDDIRQDDYKEKKHTMDYKIKEKLNIWFSLYNFFDKQQPKKGVKNMANKIKELQARMQEIISDDGLHVENDQEFGYATGQVIYYLLSCSEASKKSHALLEPFLQKTELHQLKVAISRTFNQYKHAITFFKGKFEKLMAEVLSYELDGSLKQLLPMILAGYFAVNIIYQKSDN